MRFRSHLETSKISESIFVKFQSCRRSILAPKPSNLSTFAPCVYIFLTPGYTAAGLGNWLSQMWTVATLVLKLIVY